MADIDLQAIIVNTVIASSETTSAAVDLPSGFYPVAIITPSALTGTAFTFTVAADGTNYVAMYDKTGTAYSVTVAASRYIMLPPADFCGVNNFKIVSGSTEAAARSINIVARSL